MPISRSLEATRGLAKDLAARLKPGDVVLLSGPLGSGKTCFAAGVAAALGCDEAQVSSPTFALVHEYPGRGLKVWHIDLYRLSSRREVEDLGLDEVFGAGGVCLVEWPEKLGDLAPTGAWRVELERTSETERRVELKPPGPR